MGVHQEDGKLRFSGGVSSGRICLPLKSRLRTEMLQYLKDNFRSSYRTMGKGQEDNDPGLRCQDCQGEAPPARDSQVHCLVCPAWSHLRTDLDVTDVKCLEEILPKSD